MKGLKGWLAASRQRLEEDLSQSETWWSFSAALWVVRYELVPLLQKRAHGRLLDVGCGRMPYRKYLEPHVTAYDGFDAERRSEHTLYLGDAHDMHEVADGSYDTVISLSVLEHLRRPWVAMGELARVCRPGGVVIVEVPHLSRYHELPHDYYRFTEHGLAELGRSVGLEVEETAYQKGLFTFLSHQVSTLLVSTTWGIPGLRWLVFWLNYGLIVRPSLFLDRLLRTESTLPMGVVAVFRKAP